MIELFNYETDYTKNAYNLDGDIYLDIETTGLKKYSDYAWVIGVGEIKSDKIFVTQIFISSQTDERESLLALNKILKDKSRIITFNGNIFDIPFLKARAKFYGIELSFPENAYDLYDVVRTNNRYLMIKRINLKTVEKFLNIERNDPLAGKDTMRLYKTVVETGYTFLKKTLLNHNYLDVKNLPYVMNINQVINDTKNIDSNFKTENYYILNDKLIAEIASQKKLPKISIFDKEYSIVGENTRLKISVNLESKIIDGKKVYYFSDSKKVVKIDFIFYPILKEKIGKIIKTIKI